MHAILTGHLGVPRALDYTLLARDMEMINSMKSFRLFSDLAIPEPLTYSLEDMGFTEPTPIQLQAIPPALEGRDILGTANTGTGKTGAFGIPLLANLYTSSNRALILAPTRELAAQIHLVLKKMSKRMRLRSALVVGGESFGRQVKDIEDGADYIVATPGRLNDHLEEGTIELSTYRFLVLDEVDRMLDMGFAPQVKRIMRFMPKERQTLLFSATLPDETLGFVATFLNNPVRVAIQPEPEAPIQITETTINTTNEGKKTAVIKAVEERQGRILIFTRTKSRADTLFDMLHRKGFDVAILHGGRNNSQRKIALEQFRQGKKRIMVATDLAGRGIDVEGIEHVINYDVPENREDYVHRIGRTARFGAKGEVLNLVVAGNQDSKNVIAGIKPPTRVVFSSRRRRR